ncbi:glycosyltransferase family 4 protein [Acidocella sp.]|uniref:glycosyltransferase family 4 protein n=1 Tax=Acidocella sp. TaxID=50710 RepID=UPI002629776C|nr:MraY family glycosyltransferase [Acidocella sp.]MDD2794559.1 MraY family glycosyltransferase [Acidocella sp.]
MNPAISLSLLALPRHIALMAGLAIFSAIIVRAMVTAGVPDHPAARKAHSHVTPKSGGVGIVAAFMLGVLLLHRYGQVSRIAEGYFLGVIGAAFLMAGVSFLDDLLDLSFVIKLSGQFAAGIAAIAAGLWMPTLALPYYGVLNLGWAGIPLTLLFLLFVTNAMNFIDGLNGLAAGVTLITCLFLAGIAGRYGGFFIYTASLLLAGGVLGFLPFNFPRARIFMGDVGSQFCGFMLALFGVAATRFEGAPLSFLLVPLLLSGVLYDVSFTLIRRLLAGENIARAHNGHLYQVVRRAGMDARMVAMLHWGFTVLGGVCALVFLSLPPAWKPPLLLLPLAVQIGWTIYVFRRARVANIGAW